MREAEIRIRDFLFYLMTKWKVFALTTLISVAIVVALFMVGEENKVTQTGISQDRIEQLDTYAETLANIWTIQNEEAYSSIDEHSYVLMENLSNIEWNINDMVKDKIEKDYLIAKANALREGESYIYTPVKSNRFFPKVLVVPVLSIAILIMVYIRLYSERNPFYYSDAYRWKQFFLLDSEKERLSFLDKRRFRKERVYSLETVMRVIATLCEMNNNENVYIRATGDSSIEKRMSKALELLSLPFAIKIFPKCKIFENSIEDFYAADSFVLIQKASDRLDYEFVRELEQNENVKAQSVYVITVV